MAEIIAGERENEADGLVDELHELDKGLQRETDRGAALVAATFLDDTLAVLLRAYFVQKKRIVKRLFTYPGVLSSFAARIDLTYVLGLIGPRCYLTLSTIRKIRNAFSHSRQPMNFSEPSIQTLCEKLDTLSGRSATSFQTPRELFQHSVSMVAFQLLTRVAISRHMKAGVDLDVAKSLHKRREVPLPKDCHSTGPGVATPVDTEPGDRP